MYDIKINRFFVIFNSLRCLEIIFRLLNEHRIEGNTIAKRDHIVANYFCKQTVDDWPEFVVHDDKIFVEGSINVGV